MIYPSITRVGPSQPHPGGAAGTGTAQGAQMPVWGALPEHGTAAWVCWHPASLGTKPQLMASFREPHPLHHLRPPRTCLGHPDPAKTEDGVAPQGAPHSMCPTEVGVCPSSFWQRLTRLGAWEGDNVPPPPAAFWPLHWHRVWPGGLRSCLVACELTSCAGPAALPAPL